MNETEEFEVDVLFNEHDGLFNFGVRGHDNVNMTLAMPLDDKDGAAFDWLAGNATRIIVAAMKHIIGDDENVVVDI